MTTVTLPSGSSSSFQPKSPGGGGGVFFSTRDFPSDLLPSLRFGTLHGFPLRFCGPGGHPPPTVPLSTTSKFL